MSEERGYWSTAVMDKDEISIQLSDYSEMFHRPLQLDLHVVPQGEGGPVRESVP